MVRKFLISFLVVLMFSSLDAYAQARQSELESYEEFLGSIQRIKTVSDLESSAFYIVNEHVFDLPFDSIGGYTILPAIDFESTQRLILFFADEWGNIVYATDDLYCNSWRENRLHQPYKYLAGTAFKDLNGDGLVDMVLVTVNTNERGRGQSFKTGEVLFQGDGYLYSDHIINDEINRFGMNTDVEMISACVMGGLSAEFLYTASTMDELFDKGFTPFDRHVYHNVAFENFGQVNVTCGTYYMGGHYILMVYLSDAEGSILWNIQPMEGMDNFNNIRRVIFGDADNDGLRDIMLDVVFDNLIEYGDGYRTVSTSEFLIYLQQDTGFTKYNPSAYGGPGGILIEAGPGTDSTLEER